MAGGPDLPRRCGLCYAAVEINDDVAAAGRGAGVFDIDKGDAVFRSRADDLSVETYAAPDAPIRWHRSRCSSDGALHRVVADGVGPRLLDEQPARGQSDGIVVEARGARCGGLQGAGIVEICCGRRPGEGDRGIESPG